MDLDEQALTPMAGILKVVRDRSFLGVIAQREELAVWAAARGFIHCAGPCVDFGASGKKCRVIHMDVPIFPL